MKILNIALWVVLICIPTMVLSQTGGAFTPTPPANHGCLVGNRLYYVHVATYTSGTNFRRKYDPNFFYEEGCYALGLFVNQNNLAGGMTTRNGCNTSGTDYDSVDGPNGQMYEFTAVPCSIDNNILFLFLATLGFTMISLKKYPLACF